MRVLVCLCLWRRHKAAAATKVPDEANMFQILLLQNLCRQQQWSSLQSKIILCLFSNFPLTWWWKRGFERFWQFRPQA